MEEKDILDLLEEIAEIRAESYKIYERTKRLNHLVEDILEDSP